MENVNLSFQRECLYSLREVLDEICQFNFTDLKEVIRDFTVSAWPFIIKQILKPVSNNDDEDIILQKVVKILKKIMKLLDKQFG